MLLLFCTTYPCLKAYPIFLGFSFLLSVPWEIPTFFEIVSSYFLLWNCLCDFFRQFQVIKCSTSLVFSNIMSWEIKQHFQGFLSAFAWQAANYAVKPSSSSKNIRPTSTLLMVAVPLSCMISSVTAVVSSSSFLEAAGYSSCVMLESILFWSSSLLSFPPLSVVLFLS